ncbi:MAG: DUF4377 domain-containing protein [Ardenticatenaceae bacterium]|nr:DUF4377 domain-containing protein [Anaerolineales bacterium]MCB8923845.1 DUF4377 domain-containing protein [Ardenticatenaceae bacterium]MCB9003376.1 DUF4377 domain-containing protein [Ardenticatenaceae bacterium]
MMKNRTLALILVTILFVPLLASCRQQDDSVTKTIYVAPTTITCPGTENQPCLLVADGILTDWQTREKEIKGFTLQQGSLYTLVVEETGSGNSPDWTLQEIVAQEPARIRGIILGPDRVACPNESGQMCYLYKTQVRDEWQFYNNEIGGLDFESGYAYELVVLERALPNSDANNSNTSWTVMQLLNKQPMSIMDVTPPAVEPAVPESSPTPDSMVMQTVQIPTAGMKSAIPQGWQPLNNDPTSNAAWSDGQASFANFNAVPGSDARTTLAQMVGTGTQTEPVPGQINDVQISGRNWSVYSRNNGDFSLNAAVTVENGIAYIISLYTETGHHEEILQAMLEGFAVYQP